MLSISTSITNIGDVAGNIEARLLVNNQFEAVTQINLNAGESQEVTFPIVKDQAGTYSLDINGIGTTVTIVAAAVSTPQSDSGIPDQPVETEFSLSLLLRYWLVLL